MHCNMGYILHKNGTNLMFAPVGLEYQELLTDFEVSGKLHDIEKAIYGGGYSIDKLSFIIYSVLITEEREYLFEDLLTFVVEVKNNREITIGDFFRCIDRITKLDGECEASHYIHSATLYLCSILLKFERLSTRCYDLRIFGDKIKTIDRVMSRKVGPKENSITEIELHIHSRGIENENYPIKRYVLPLEIEKKLYEQIEEWHNRVGSVRIDELSPTCQKLISKRKIGENCKIILDNHATDSIALVLSKIDEIIDDGNTDIAIYKDQIRYVYLGVLLTQYDRDKDYEKLQKGKKRKQLLKKSKNIGYILLTLLTLIIILCCTLFSVAKWGLPLSDKDILEAAIKNEFMFKELGIRNNKYAIKNIADKELLECYIELAKGDKQNLNTARFSRYFYNNRGYGKAKRKLYEWNYKLNRK